MRYLLIILLFIANAVQAQFPTTDSLRKFNNKYIQNSPINAFTNQRMNTLLYGIINHIDSARLGTLGSVGVDTLFTINDSTIRYKKNGVFFNFKLPSYARIVNDTTLIVNGDTVNVGGTGGGSNVLASAPVVKDLDTIKLSYNTEGLRVKDNAIDAKAKVFNSAAALRALTSGDTSSVYRVRINREYGEFKYDPDDVSSADDSAMVLVDASGNRYKRVVNDVIYPEDFGANGDGVTDDAAAFNKMYRWVEANIKNLKEVKHKNQSYFFGSTVYLPGNLAVDGKLLKLKIEGKGVIYKTTNAITILDRWPTSQTQALDQWISDYSLELKGIRFEGTSTTGQVGLRLGAAYTPVLEDCHFAFLDTGVVAAFWLNGRIHKNFFTLNKSVAFKGSSGEGYWTGGSNSNSAFNINEFAGNRIFNGNGSYAGLYFFAADGLLVRDLISEGFNPRYDIYNESQAATVVNGNTYENIWFESIGGINGSKNVCFYSRPNGTTYIKGFQNDYADTLLQIRNPVASSHYVVQNIQYYNVSGKLLDAGGSYWSGRTMDVNNCAQSFANIFTDTTYWVGGVVGLDISSFTKDKWRTSNTDIYLKPNQSSTNRGVWVDGKFDFETDNTWNIGGTAANRRPQRVAAGTQGMLVDPLSSIGFSFATPLDAGNFKFNWVRNGVAQMTSTGGLIMPRGTTAQRTPASDFGALRYNTDSLAYEFADGTSWNMIPKGSVSGGGVADPMRLSTDQVATGKKTFNPDVTATSGRAYALESNPTLRAAANNDILVGLRVNATVVPGAFTGVSYRGVDIQVPASGVDLYSYLFNSSGTAGSNARYIATSQTTSMQFGSDGIIQTSGTGITNQIPSGQFFKMVFAGVEKSRWSSTGLRLGDNTNPTYSLEIAGTDAIKFPVGTTAQRPTGTNGLVRYNSDSSRYEGYAGGTWKGLAFTNELGSGGGGGTSSESMVKVNNADYTITDGTGNLSVVFYNTLTAARTLTLPTASSNTGRVIRIKHGGSGLYNINLSTSIYESDTVSFTSIGVGQGAVIQSDGTNWIIIQ